MTTTPELEKRVKVLEKEVLKLKKQRSAQKARTKAKKKLGSGRAMNNDDIQTEDV